MENREVYQRLFTLSNSWSITITKYFSSSADAEITQTLKHFEHSRTTFVLLPFAMLL